MKLAHISDFHLRHHLPGSSALTDRKSRQMPDLIARAVAHMCAEAPDLVAVTGDLVDYPLDQMDDAEAIALGEKDLHLVRDLFAPLSCPVAFLYGNHDHPASFHRVFGDQPDDFGVGNHRVILFFDDEGESHVPQRQGAQRTRFHQVLSDADPRPQIHLQHYLIAPERNEGYPHTYADGQALKTALLHDPRPKLALSGHYHKGEPVFSENHVHFAVARAFCEPPHPYRFYTIGKNAVTQTECALSPA